MPAKRKKAKIPFKVFASNNYSRFASRFPFLKEPQIKAKLLQAWRNALDTKRQTEETEHSLCKASKIETLMTLFVPFKQKQQDSQSSSTQSPHSSFSSAVSGSLSEDSSCSKHRAPSELIDLLQEISAEQLLIEPEQMCSAEDLGFLNHNAFQERLGQNTQENKYLIMEWRAIVFMGGFLTWEEKDLFLVGNDSEGDSNFLSMFNGENDIFFEKENKAKLLKEGLGFIPG
ncbi:uncharacterized protein [Montipora capricornis]|uniref:uncharacterized protein n=1 Tax=Montipora capricornis TaxID=246305 RepID=UPI0035F11096